MKSHLSGPFEASARRIALKKVEAIIRHFKLDEVVEALVQLGIPGLTVMDARGNVSRQSSLSDSQGAAEFLPKVILELVVLDEQVRNVVDTIRRTAHTTQPGDGKVLVSDIIQTIRIRTGETLDFPLAFSA